MRAPATLAASLPDPRAVLRRVAALAPKSPRARRRALLATIGALLLTLLYFAWFRDSSLVRVDRVTVSGLTTADARQVREALTTTGHEMTTLHVRRDRLMRAVAGFAIVDRLEVSASFPNGLRIHVVERRPAAVLMVGGRRLPVAADGTVLQGLGDVGRLPTVRSATRPGDRVREPASLRLVRIAGAAPAPLRARMADVRETRDRGIVVRLRDGPELVFGDLSRLRDKWIAAARVLADPDARGASYVDVRLPERTAVGGLPAGATATPSTSALSAAPPSGTSPTTAARAGAGSTTQTPTGTPTTGAPATGATGTGAAGAGTGAAGTGAPATGQPTAAGGAQGGAASP